MRQNCFPWVVPSGRVRMHMLSLGAACMRARAAWVVTPLILVWYMSTCGPYMCATQAIPPFWAADTPIDTCGAGDAYAAGLLYARLSGLDPAGMGAAAARAASAAIARRGAAISAEDASAVVAAVAARRAAGARGSLAWAVPLGGEALGARV